MKKIRLSLLIVLCLVACTTAQPTPAPTTQPPADPLPTPTSEPPDTAEELPLFSITFEGNGCSSDIPETLPIGKYSFLVMNDSDTDYALWVTMMVGDITYQDLLDRQSEPGEYFDVPYNFQFPTKLAQRWDDELGGKFYTFSFTEEGEYYTALGYVMDRLWFCSQFHIAAESASE